MRSFLHCARLAVSLLVVAGCGDRAPYAPGFPATGSPAKVHLSAAYTTPALITVDTHNGSLAYWPIKRGGSDAFASLTGPLGITNPYAMAANGDVLAIANYSPAQVVTYNVKTKALTVLADPYGGPVDVAVDRNGTFYALNLANVAVYKAGSSKPSELTCSSITEAEAIAVNNEGDVFVDGYGPQGFMGVVEYAAGSKVCTKPHLGAARGYIAGVGIDPKTDDLIVVEDPDLCAGGLEGRMLIYPKPYEQRSSVRHVLRTTYCAGTFRLNARSTLIFYADATVSAGFPLIDQATYPGGKYRGNYENGLLLGRKLRGLHDDPKPIAELMYPESSICRSRDHFSETPGTESGMLPA